MDNIKCKYKNNDCFIKRYIESYILYKISQYSEDYCRIEQIFVTHNRYSYEVNRMKTEYCSNFDTLDRFSVEEFDKLRDKIQVKENIDFSELELINCLLNDIKTLSHN